MKLSIIIPTVGRSTLKPVIESLFMSKKFAQFDIEILVIFDGPRRERFFVDDSRVKIFSTVTKKYASGARNLGLDKASGDIIAFLGDDTLVDPYWLAYTMAWHRQYPEITDALLGRIYWTSPLDEDPFHVWLESHAQFDYKKLDRGQPPSWKHFYTANVSLKKAAIGTERFSAKFVGWGFEDSEFAYRLHQQGLKIFYEPSVKVFHNDKQTLGRVIDQTQSARQNAFVFERLHPEVQLLPTGIKKLVLKEAVMWAGLFQFISKVKWWRAWKKAWLGLS